jgi:cytochrome c
MKTTLTTLAFTAMFAMPALAESHAAGDAEAGAKVFNQCQTCHVVANEAGEVLAGKKSKTGPNLYGIVGRTAGTYPEFAYGDSIVAAGAGGLVWDEATLAEYLADPAAFLKTTLDDKGAKSKMAFKLRKPEDAANVVAFIASLSPAADGAAAAPAEGDAAAPAANP